MKHRRPKLPLVLPRTPLLERLRRGGSPVMRAARVRGNASGIHGGGRKPRYRDRDRHADRQHERQARWQDRRDED